MALLDLHYCMSFMELRISCNILSFVLGKHPHHWMASVAPDLFYPVCDSSATRCSLSNPNHSRRKVLQICLFTMTKSILSSLPISTLCAEEMDQVYNLPNGTVRLPRALNLNGSIYFIEKVLGSGSGGVVFAAKAGSSLTSNSGRSGLSDSSCNNELLAIKVSWYRSASSILREGRILRRLNSRQVPNVETLLQIHDFTQANQDFFLAGRVVLVMKPAIENAKSLLDPPSAENANTEERIRVISELGRTTASIISAGVALNDVQILYHENGSILWIDMSEGIECQEPLGDFDNSAIRSFLSEMLSLPLSEKELERMKLSVSHTARVLLKENKMTRETFDVVQSMTS